MSNIKFVSNVYKKRIIFPDFKIFRNFLFRWDAIDFTFFLMILSSFLLFYICLLDQWSKIENDGYVKLLIC
jgi:hypothetical protein